MLGGFAALFWSASTSATQQPVVIDEGSFRITRAGQPFGTESFKITRRTGPAGPEFLAQGTRVQEGRILKTALTVDSSGSATLYSIASTGGPAAQLTARRTVGRLRIDETGARAATEDVLFPAGSLILDDDLVHELYFVTWRGAPGPIAYVVPATRRAIEAV